jgi:serine/threonine protein kinase
MKRSFSTWEECTELRELKSLVKISKHENIVQLHEVIREHDEKLYFVFEYMPDGNLYEFIKRCSSPVTSSGVHHVDLLTGNRIQSILKQVLEGISHLHKHGYIHRDIKPENILCHGDRIKVADFGLARECCGEETFTEYVSTRWYRAPEILLQSKQYGKPVDLFAVGCIMAELFSRVPLFPGEDEIDQLHKLCEVLGSPTSATWPTGLELASNLGFDFPKPPTKSVRVSLQRRVSKSSTKMPPSAIQLMKDLLEWNPKQRPTAEESLTSDYFVSRRESPISVVHHGLVNSAKLEISSSSPNSMSSLSAAQMIQLPPIGEYNGMKRSRDQLYSSPRSTHEYSQSTHGHYDQHFECNQYFDGLEIDAEEPVISSSSTKKPRQLFAGGPAMVYPPHCN